MTHHPDDLLAEYVDGALSGEELHGVERHLASCERCRSEVDLGAGARAALASLVEPPVPARVGGAAIEEAERGVGGDTVGIGRRRAGAPARYRWAAGAAAAAALLVVVLALPHLGSEPGAGQLAAPGAESAANDRVKRADTVEIEHRNYDTEDVTALALSYRMTPVPATPQSSEANAVGQDAQRAFSVALTPDALTCLATAIPNIGGEPVRLIRARFEGTPAFIGVYLEGPGAGQPPDTVRVWVVAERGCAILAATRASI